VGVADRGCWDLSRHIEFSKADLTAFKRYDGPQEVEKEVIKARYDLLGPDYKAKAGKIGKALEAMEPSKISGGNMVVEVDGEEITLDGKYFEVTKVKDKVTGLKCIPHVIEPSHGLDRILYTCLEHAYTQKDDYIILRLSPNVAPIKVGVFPLMNKDQLGEMAQELDEDLRFGGIETYYDDSGSIGRRYARMDEIGTPFCVTVDDQSLEDGTVTIRERDSTEQLRVNSINVKETIVALLSGMTIEEIKLRLE
jgi:glycyl-tRNA synthetase